MNDEDATCAGKVATSAMYPLSHDFLNGCAYFASRIANASDNDEIRYCNISCVMFASSYLESWLNEWIAIGKQIKDTHIPEEFLISLEESQKNLRIQEKWNLYSSIAGGS